MAVNRVEFSEQGVIVLTPTEELLTADVIQTIEDWINSAATKLVIIDFANICVVVTSMYPHAAPLPPLIKLNRRMQDESRRLVLCNLSSDLAEIFRITRLDRFFEIQPDVETAMSSKRGQS